MISPVSTVAATPCASPCARARKERFGFHAVGRVRVQRPVVIYVRKGFGIALVGQGHVAVRYVQNGKRRAKPSMAIVFVVGSCCVRIRLRSG